MVVKRTFIEKQAAARAIVKSREVSRIERGYLTSRERSVEFREGKGVALERAKFELAEAQKIATPTKVEPPKVLPARVIPPRQKISITGMMRSVGEVITEPPMRVTKVKPPPLPTAKVFMGTRPYGAGVIPVFEERPISEVPIAIAPKGFEFAPLVSEVRPAEKITPVKKLRVKVIKTITPSGFELLAGAISVPVGLAKLPYEIYKRPKETLAQLISPAAWIESGRRIYRGLGAGDPRVFGEAIGMGVLAKLPKVGRLVRRKVTPVITRISPKFRGIVEVGRRRVIPKIPTTKGITDIMLEPRVTKRILVPIREQVMIAGRRVTAVTAARDIFGRIIRRRKVVIKKPPIEPFGLYADPLGRLRTRFLKLKEPRAATLRELITGRAVIRRPRPQAVIFPDQIVAKFPKALKKVKAKLRAGKTLTKTEQAKLLKFQLEPTGEFKPVGFVTREPEITLAPSEIIRRRKTVGVTLIKGRRVPIIEAEVIKPSKAAAKLLKKRRAGTITPQELSLLKSRLKRETGFDVSRALERRPYYDPLRVPKLLGISPVITPPPRVRRVPAIRPKVAVRPPYKPIPALELIAPSPLVRPKIMPRARYMAQILGIPAMTYPVPKPPRLRRQFELREKETKEERKRRKRAEAIARKQQLAYAASVGAVTLGITAPRIPTDILTGLELRPVVRRRKGSKRKKKSRSSNNYINNLNKILR